MFIHRLPTNVYTCIVIFRRFSELGRFYVTLLLTLKANTHGDANAHARAHTDTQTRARAFTLKLTLTHANSQTSLNHFFCNKETVTEKKIE